MHTFHPYHVGFSNDCSIDLTLTAFKRPTKATKKKRLYIETQLFEWENDVETSRFQSLPIELEYRERCRKREKKPELSDAEPILLLCPFPIAPFEQVF